MSAQEQPNPAARVHTIEGEPLWIGDVGDCGTAMAPPRSIGEYYFVSHELRSSSGESEWHQQLSVDGININFKLDLGAVCNILPAESFSRLPVNRQRQSGHRGAVFVTDFVVVDELGQPPLLGLPSCDKLNLIRRVHAVHTPGDHPPAVPTKRLGTPTLQGRRVSFT